MIKMSVEEIKRNYTSLWFITNEIKGIHGLSHILIDKHGGKYHRALSFWRITSSRT
jgi:endonuclease-3